jgi:L-arabinokinase
VSGHGLGHACRIIEVLNTLTRLAPRVRLIVRTNAPRWLFDRTVDGPLEFHEQACDPGVAQIDSLRPDEAETIRRAEAFYEDLPARAAAEAEWLLHESAGTKALVVGDIPPLAFEAAAAAGMASVAVGNFTWDWIYEGYAAAPFLPIIRSAYARARVACRLPMWGGFDAFRTVVDVPFIARHARRGRDEVRRALRLPPDRTLVLVSFGGYGLGGLSLGRIDAQDPYSVVMTGPGMRDSRLPVGVVWIDEHELYASGCRYEDLVGAVDVVATKPGYGIISECIANGTAMLYTSRGRFAEYDVLVREMPRYLRCAFIDHESLFAGRWASALDELMAQPAPPERPATNGAEVVASTIFASLS